jgi:DNA-binding transcriptional LysR family regulator
MDLHQLRVFQAVARSGGFTRAAEHLHLSQSTVSQHVKQLEHELGCPLFLRVGKRVLVSEAGTLLLQHADRIFLELKNAEMNVREMSSLKRGTVRLGVGPTTLTYRLPQILANYNRQFPEIDLVVLATTTELLLKAMRAQELDLAILIWSKPEPGLAFTPLGGEELVVLLHSTHPLAQRRTLEPSDLASLRFILYQKGTAMQNLIDVYFERLRVSPRIAIEVEGIEAMKSLVRAGMGAAIVPLCAVEGLGRASQLRVFRVKGEPLVRNLSLAALDAQILPNAIRQLMSMLAKGLYPSSTSMVAVE